MTITIAMRRPRKPRERARNRPQGHVTPDVVLSERPAADEDRAVPGHREGDLIMGCTAPQSAPSWNAPATTRCSPTSLDSRATVIESPVKNGPAPGGYRKGMQDRSPWWIAPSGSAQLTSTADLSVTRAYRAVAELKLDEAQAS